MKELSVFVDESGDFGRYQHHSPFYIVTLVFHDQSVDVSTNINRLNDSIRLAGLSNTPIHTGPLIRKENEYRNLSLPERKRIFNFLYNFVRTTDIAYHSVVVEKKSLVEEIDLHIQITKHLSLLLKEYIERFSRYGRTVIYYDYGQMELTKILVSVFNSVLSNVEFKKVVPANYKLFQAADMLCTIELLSAKAERKMLSKSDLLFFESEKNLYKSYLRAIIRKRFR